MHIKQIDFGRHKYDKKIKGRQTHEKQNKTTTEKEKETMSFEVKRCGERRRNIKKLVRRDDSPF